MWEVAKRLQAMSAEPEPDKQEFEKLAIEFYGIMQLLSQQSEVVTTQSQSMVAQLGEFLKIGSQQEPSSE